MWEVLNSYKHRFLIADDVGLGKTIEAGMILKEIALRGRARRVLIIVPSPLGYQWRREMRERFDEHFIIYESNYLKTLKDSLPKDANVWEAHDKIITSIDYAKREEILAELERTYWDLIIFDEAHKLSATKYGNKVQRSQRYRLAEKSLLLLTATPHKGDSFAFYSLISLVAPYIFENENKIFSQKLNSIMVRRGKNGLKDENGKPIMVKRPIFTYNELPYYMNMSANFISAKNKEFLKYLTCLLNSNLAYFWFKYRAKQRGVHLDIGGATLGRFPIRRIAFTTPKHERKRLVEKFKRRYEEWVEK